MKKRLFALLTVLALLAAVPGISALGEAAQEWENMREYMYTFREEVKMVGKTVPMVLDYIDEEEAREREFTVYYVEGGDIPYVALKDFMPVLSHMITYGEKDIEEEIGSNLYSINAGMSDNDVIGKSEPAFIRSFNCQLKLSMGLVWDGKPGTDF